MTAELFTATISAGMQAIELWLNLRDRAKASELFARIPQIRNTASNIAEANNLTHLVPEEILDQFTNRVNRCFERYKAMLRDENYLPQEIDDGTDAVKSCVCRELRRLHSLNGFIPEGILQAYWQQYNCALN